MVISTKMIFNFSRLQQCLPFTVLKRALADKDIGIYRLVATVLTVYGIETLRP